LRPKDQRCTGFQNIPQNFHIDPERHNVTKQPKMKFTSTIILIASIASNTHAAENLRAGASSTPGIDESEQEQAPPAEGLLLLAVQEENPNNRSLKGGDDRVASVLVAKSGGADELHAEEQREATREKHQKMTTPLDETSTTTGDMPSFEMTPIEAPMEPYAEEAGTNSSDFGISIVGGDVSDAGEFPYYGESFLRPILEQRSDYLLAG
jgi:hypothetical protein